MRHYFQNLITALLGSNPYQKELDDVREKYGKTAERVGQLEDMYYKSLEKWEEAGRQGEEASKQLAGYQTLVENLRDRVAEKDALIAQLKEEAAARADGYKRRIEDYSAQVARLQADLAKARKRSRTAGRKNVKKKDSHDE